MNPLHNPEPVEVLRAAPQAIASVQGARPFTIIARFGGSAPGHRLGVLDSSFNPPTLGHSAMVLDLAGRERIDRALLLLSVENADKTAAIASFPYRLAMMAAAAAELAPEIPCEIGILRAPLFIDKAWILKAAYEAETELHFILGDDTLIRLFETRYYQGSVERRDAAMGELTGLAKLVSFGREGVHGSERKTLDALFHGPAGAFLSSIERRSSPFPGRDISSERARDDLLLRFASDALSPAVEGVARRGRRAYRVPGQRGGLYGPCFNRASDKGPLLRLREQAVTGAEDGFGVADLAYGITTALRWPRTALILPSDPVNSELLEIDFSEGLAGFLGERFDLSGLRDKAEKEAALRGAEALRDLCDAIAWKLGVGDRSRLLRDPTPPGQRAIDINHAEASRLRAMPGLSERAAEAILEQRALCRRFERPEQLAQVLEMGVDGLRLCQSFIRFSSGPAC